MIVRAVVGFSGAIALAAAVFAISFFWDDLATALRKPADEEVAEEPDGAEEDEAEEEEEEDESGGKMPMPAPALSQQAWIHVSTEGEEGNPVEMAYEPESGWRIEGWRVKGLSLYGAPPFRVPARKVDEVPMFPCSDCHKKMVVNRRPRVLTEDHEDLVVNHANDRIWCTDCHGGKGMDFLYSRRGNPIDMDLGYLHCGECHFNQMKDWEFGVHGRRVGLWAGERVLHTCTECHDAHQPQIKPLKPNPPPQWRPNLSAFAPKPRSPAPIWERFSPGASP